MIRFVEKNIKEFPGNATLKLTVTEPKNNWKISLVSLTNGFEMNNEMIDFLQQKQELEVQVITAWQNTWAALSATRPKQWQVLHNFVPALRVICAGLKFAVLIYKNLK